MYVVITYRVFSCFLVISSALEACCFQVLLTALGCFNFRVSLHDGIVMVMGCEQR